MCKIRLQNSWHDGEYLNFNDRLKSINNNFYFKSNSRKCNDLDLIRNNNIVLCDRRLVSLTYLNTGELNSFKKETVGYISG